MASEIQRNDKLIATNIDKEIKRFEMLDKTFTKLSLSEKKVKEERKSAIEEIAKIEEENAYLSDMYKNFKQTMLELEQSRQVKIDKYDKTIIPAIKYYPTKAKGFKKPLNELSDMGKTIQKHNTKIQKAIEKSDIDAKNQHEQEKHKLSQSKDIIGKGLEKEIVEFEANRVDDNKAVLLHFIHAELAYHANAMQTLTKLYQEINILEPKEKLKDFIQKYNLNSMRDYNLEDKFKYKEGETERKINEYKNKTNRNNVIEDNKKGKLTSILYIYINYIKQ
jgi:hypothetical protein